MQIVGKYFRAILARHPPVLRDTPDSFDRRKIFFRRSHWKHVFIVQIDIRVRSFCEFLHLVDRKALQLHFSDLDDQGGLTYLTDTVFNYTIGFTAHVSKIINLY